VWTCLIKTSEELTKIPYLLMIIKQIFDVIQYMSYLPIHNLRKYNFSQCKIKKTLSMLIILISLSYSYLKTVWFWRALIFACCYYISKLMSLAQFIVNYLTTCKNSWLMLVRTPVSHFQKLICSSSMFSSFIFIQLVLKYNKVDYS